MQNFDFVSRLIYFFQFACHQSVSISSQNQELFMSTRILMHFLFPKSNLSAFSKSNMILMDIQKTISLFF